VIIFGVGYMFFIRPRAQAARRQRDTLMELSPGDEVLTGAGIFGTVLDVESDRVTLETAPGTRITVLRSTIARRITEPAPETPNWDEHDEDEAHGAYHDYEDDHPGDEHDDPGDEHDDPGDEHDGDDGDEAHEDHEHEDDDVQAQGHDGEGDDDIGHDETPEPDGAGDNKK